jgi:hypothetical protein
VAGIGRCLSSSRQATKKFERSSCERPSDLSVLLVWGVTSLHSIQFAAYYDGYLRSLLSTFIGLCTPVSRHDGTLSPMKQ